MISPQLQLLLERRAELQDLFDAVQYQMGPTDPNSVQLLERAAARAIQIIQEWPEEYWPLESEENTWSDRETHIEMLDYGIKAAQEYCRRIRAKFDFDEWMLVKRDVLAALYHFRDPKEPIGFDEE
jgi:hypothetical protein